MKYLIIAVMSLTSVAHATDYPVAGCWVSCVGEGCFTPCVTLDEPYIQQERGYSFWEGFETGEINAIWCAEKHRLDGDFEECFSDSDTKQFFSKPRPFSDK